MFDTREVKGNISTVNSILSIENENLQKKRAIYQQKASVLTSKLKTNEFILENLKQLVDSGGYQRLQYLSKLDEVYELKSNLESLELESSRLELEAKKSINQLNNSLKQLNLQLQYQTIVANSDGLIFDSSINDDSVVSSGESLLEIAPQSGLKAMI